MTKQKCQYCGKEFEVLKQHLRHCSPQRGAPASPKAVATNEMQMFTVIQGDIQMRACEFEGGFIVLDGETLRFHKSLSAALRYAARDIEEKSRQDNETHDPSANGADRHASVLEGESL